MIIDNILDINSLHLTWIAPTNRNRRYCVGVLSKSGSDYSFKYLVGTKDYEDAIVDGFLGYPSFKLSDNVFTNDVMTIFAKRLPSRNRRDFIRYLEFHHLPLDFQGTDFQLICHTGVQLPSDGFDLIPCLAEASIPFDYVMEVVGTRYQDITSDDVWALAIGSEVILKEDNDNQHDKNAVAVIAENKYVGFVNRLQCTIIRQLMKNKKLTAKIIKTSGTELRPLIYLRISVR